MGPLNSKIDDTSDVVRALFVLNLFYDEPMNPACANCDDESIESKNKSEIKVKTNYEDQY